MTDLDAWRPGADPVAERRRLTDRAQRADALRDLWWRIVKDPKGWEKARMARLVRWAREGLDLDR